MQIQSGRTVPLKGQCHEIFCFRFYSWIIFPQAPDNNVRIISNFLENLRRYSQVKVHHWCRWQICNRYQWRRQKILPSVPLVLLTPVANCCRYQRQRRQICHRYQQRQRQILPSVPLVLLTPVANLPPVSTIPAANLPPVSTIPAANLPPVSTTPVANWHWYQWHRHQICYRCHWHWWQIMETISGCRHLEVNLKAKICIYVSSTT